MKFSIRTSIFALITLFFSAAFAADPTWQIVPNESSIKFTATQNGAPVTGEFKTFTGNINFDPNKLATDNVTITVDLNSVTTSYGEVANTLKTADWFNVKAFPQAVFKSTSFTKVNNNTYQSNGTLTIRDKTLPLVLTFDLDQYAPTKFHLTGKTQLKRTAFGIGQGDWAKTDQIKDDVQVNFVVAAINK